ncbi:protein-L-isoaspartate(D-aspartate) O-methyltransferase [Thalassoglobus polymorphus]|uniref:Protein-L-isoaspartate O-methyltransferase n=1 Tax=Thalassoglobus polymorphus TaxID=2527994 RepID=A0A517QNR6_9PLAN|nr:protein-L-isoaspartate(D-aspartate) O-methyltransferase [Thalassoglobus polymorphus]QDT33288.1 Protein-L-isoaspartate O-methyltransferase [Thalassoglobus polymorphus]
MSRILKPITFTILAVICSASCPSSYAQSRDPYAPERAKMVEEYISSEGVKDPRVLEAMGTVPRHLFVRPNFRYLAYTDQALDIGFKQTISPPFIVAYMTEMLATKPTDKVLEIGTGSGYQAAVLSGLVQDVYTIEIVEPLGQRTQKLLKRLKYDNVHTKIGDGYQGWPEHAPFDKIIVTCSPESVPAPLVEQLKEGGRMIVPLGERYQQVFYLFEKENGKLKQTKLLPTLFVPMTGQMEELRKVKPDPLNPRIINGGFEDDENEDGLADHWHYVRRGELSDESSAGRKSIRFENSESGRMSHMLQGMAIDGSRISEARVSWAMKSENIRSGRAAQQQPGIAFYFYDSRRLPIGRVAIGPWLADQEDWKRSSTVIKIPRNAKEAIIQAGLNGSTGILYLDEIQLTPIR